MKKILFLIPLILLGYIAWKFIPHYFQTLNFQQKSHKIISEDSILTQIRDLNRLESNTFYFDTIIRTQKDGNWYKLWQDSEKGIFVVKGNVVAGIDLDLLKPEHIHIDENQHIHIDLPAAEILSVQLQHIETYDLHTGLLNLLHPDNTVFNLVQTQAKQQLLEQACHNGILNQAQQRAQQQLTHLFALTHTTVQIHSSQTSKCRMPIK